MMFTHKNSDDGLLRRPCFTFGLAACGGGGGDAPVTSMINGNGEPPEGPPESGPTCATPATSQACVDEKKMALDEAMEALDAAEADGSSTTLDQIKAAEMAVDDAQGAYDDAMEARNTYLAMQPSTYDAKAMATAFDNVLETLEGGLTTGNTDPADDTVRGGMVTVEDGTPPANTYAKAAWPVPTITGWAGSVWERSSSPMDSVVVYTNIQDAKGAKWSVYYAIDADAPMGDKDGFTWMDRHAVVDSANADGVITFAEIMLDADAAKLFSAAMFPTGDGAGQTYPDGDECETNVQVEFAGSFHGVAGMFMCDAPACSAHNDEDGGLMTLTGEWTFTPTSTDSMVADVRTDADYLDFGYWVNTDDSGDTVEYMVNTFFRGEAPYGDVGNVVGSATYKGAAAGLYTKRALTPGGDGDVTAAGRFTADAELMAYFGQPAPPDDNIPPNMEDSISGTIKNFMDGGMMIDAAWLVELNKIDGENGETYNASGSEGTFTGGTTTGGGTWSGTFYGDNSSTPATDDDQNATLVPTGVAGEFDAVFNNGDLMGSFGATKTKK